MDLSPSSKSKVPFFPYSWQLWGYSCPQKRRGSFLTHPTYNCSGMQTQDQDPDVLLIIRPTSHPVLSQAHLPDRGFCLNLYHPTASPGQILYSTCPSARDTAAEGFTPLVLLHLSLRARVSADASSRMVSRVTALWPCPPGRVTQGARRPDSATADR